MCYWWFCSSKQNELRDYSLEQKVKTVEAYHQWLAIELCLVMVSVPGFTEILFH